MKRLGLYLTDELYEDLRKESYETHTSMNSLVIKKLGGGKSPVRYNYPKGSLASEFHPIPK